MRQHNATYYLQRLPIYSACLATLMSGVSAIVDIPMAFKIAYELMVITYGFWIAYKFARTLRLCRLVRFGIYYTYAFFVCIWLKRYPDGEDGFFGRYIDYAYLVMFMIGMCYLAYFVHKKRKGEVSC